MPCLGSDRVNQVVDHLSKNTLADIVIAHAIAQVGEDASDEQILGRIQSWLDPVQRIRGARPVNLIGLVGRFERREAKYLELQLAAREQAKVRAEQERLMAEKIDEYKREKLKEPAERSRF